MAARNESLVLGDDIAFGDDEQPLSVDAQAHRPIGERRRYAVAVPLEGHQAARRHPLSLLEAGIERRQQRHRPGPLFRPNLGHP